MEIYSLDINQVIGDILLSTLNRNLFVTFFGWRYYKAITRNITALGRNITENFNSHFPRLEGGLWRGSGKNFVATIRKHIFMPHWPLHILWI